MNGKTRASLHKCAGHNSSLEHFLLHTQQTWRLRRAARDSCSSELHVFVAGFCNAVASCAKQLPGTDFSNNFYRPHARSLPCQGSVIDGSGVMGQVFSKAAACLSKKVWEKGTRAYDALVRELSIGRMQLIRCIHV